MFKKLNPKEDIATFTQMKSSKVRELREQLSSREGVTPEIVETLLPRKATINIVKLHNRCSLLVINNYPRFFQIRDGPFIPTLRVLHSYPMLLPRMQVDEGAIKFIIRGADVMCPGLNHKNGKMEDVEEGDIVGIYAYGKTNAMAIGCMKMPTKAVKKVNSGVAIEMVHHLGDGLFRLTDVTS